VTGVQTCALPISPHPEIHKTALGAEDSVQWKYFESSIHAIDHLKGNHYQIYALEQTENSIDVRNFKPTSNAKYAFVFGNELKGVSQEVLDKCNGSLEIPQFGTKHSFNVAVTAGIVIWDFFSKIKG